MRIGILSDLYIDKLGLLPIPETMPDILVLAGNIGFGTRGIKWATQAYTCPIVYVLGSYSYRYHNIDTFDEELRSNTWGSNLHLLQNETLIIRGVRFIGSTLWTDFALCGNVALGMLAAQTACPEYRLIHNNKGEELTPAYAAVLHRQAVEYLWRTATEPYDDGHTVVVTHHAPSRRSVPAAYRDDPSSACFASNLDDLVESADAMLWVHAGVHGPANYTLGSVRVVANPRGTSSEEGVHGIPQFRPDYAVEI